MNVFYRVCLVILGVVLFASCDKKDDVVNQAPSAPYILLPIDKAENLDTKQILKWITSEDPEKEVVHYEVYLSKSN